MNFKNFILNIISCIFLLSVAQGKSGDYTANLNKVESTFNQNLKKQFKISANSQNKSISQDYADNMVFNLDDDFQIPENLQNSIDFINDFNTVFNRNLPLQKKRISFSATYNADISTVKKFILIRSLRI